MKQFLNLVTIILALVSVVGFKSSACANPQTIDFAVYIGGTVDDRYNVGNVMAVDAAGNVYVAGQTRSPDYPVTAGAAQTTFGGGIYDAVVTKFDPTGAVVYSTFVGGRIMDTATGIVVDDAGAAYVVGQTTSPDFPVTAGAVSTWLHGIADAFVVKINPAGSAFEFATYVGGSDIEKGIAITRDSSNNIYITGNTYSHDFPRSPSAPQISNGGYSDVFVAKLDSALSNILWATYLGGTQIDMGFGIEVDGTGIYVSGGTRSPNFPTTAGAYQTASVGLTVLDAFVTKFDHSGAVVYSTLIGGSATDKAYSGLKVDAAGAVYLAGVTESTNFPVSVGPAGIALQAFALKLNPSGSALEFSTTFGDTIRMEVVRGMEITQAGEMLITGGTTGINFPVTADAWKSTKLSNYHSSFLAKVSNTGTLLYASFLDGLGTINESSQGRGVVVDSVGSVYVTGNTRSTDLVTTDGSVNSGGMDLYLMKFQSDTPAPAPTPALGFEITKAEIKLDRGPGFDRFKIEGFLKEPMDPSNSTIAFGFDTWADVIPAGSFKAHSDNYKFKADGIEFKIYINGRFKIEGKRVDLGNIDLSNPVAFGLQIDEYVGSASLNLTKRHNKRSAKLERKQERHAEKKESHGLFSKSDHKPGKSVFFGRAG